MAHTLRNAGIDQVIEVVEQQIKVRAMLSKVLADKIIMEAKAYVGQIPLPPAQPPKGK